MTTTSAVEQRVRELVAAQRVAEAAEVTLRAHGPEILGFLAATLRSEADAGDVFSTFSVDVWRGLPSWRGDAALRAWLFAVARNASHRFRRKEGGQRARHVTLDDQSPLSRLVHELRQSTMLHLKTETKSAVQRLREQLSVEEQELLTLRIDKKLEWDEVALVSPRRAACCSAPDRRRAVGIAAARGDHHRQPAVELQVTTGCSKCRSTR